MALIILHTHKLSAVVESMYINCRPKCHSFSSRPLPVEIWTLLWVLVDIRCFGHPVPVVSEQIACTGFFKCQDVI